MFIKLDVDYLEMGRSVAIINTEEIASIYKLPHPTRARVYKLFVGKVEYFLNEESAQQVFSAIGASL